MSNVDKIIEQGTKTALRWKEEMPRVLTSCGEAFNYSIDKTGDAVWAGVFEKERPNEAARFKVCADEDEAREFCKMIEGSGKLPLCMGRNAAAEDAGADVAGDQTITLPEYGEELQDVSGSGKMPKSASAPDGGTVQAVVDWLMAGDLSGYDHGTAMSEYGNRYWQIVRDALDGDLYEAVVAKLEADGIEGDWKEGKTAQQMPVDPKEMSEEELKKRAIRDNMKAENDAIMMYGAYIDLLPEGDPVRKGLEDIRDEEKKHAGELHKLLIDLDPSEEDEFNEGIGEVEKESGRKVGETPDAFTSLEDLYRLYRDMYRGSNPAVDEIVGNMWRLIKGMADEAGVYVSAGRKERSMKDSVEQRHRAARRLHDKSRKAAKTAKTAANYSDDERPFYAFYEGQTKDKKATIGVVQQQIGSRPQLSIVSEKGQVHDFGMYPNMDYALRQAERFEKMSYPEVVAAAPYKTVRVTTAGIAQEKTASVNVVDHGNGSYAVEVTRMDGSGRSNGVYDIFSYDVYGLERWENPKQYVFTWRDTARDEPMYLSADTLEEAISIIEDFTMTPNVFASKTAQQSDWNKLSDDYWYKYVKDDGSTLNVSFDGWTNAFNNLYYSSEGCYAYYESGTDRDESFTVARVKTTSIDFLPLEEQKALGYDGVLAKYDNPVDGFSMIDSAMEYCAQLADEWLAQNMQSLPKTASADDDIVALGDLCRVYDPSMSSDQVSKIMSNVSRLVKSLADEHGVYIASRTAQDEGWDEEGGVWGKFVGNCSLEVDYDYSTPGKYHWEVIDMSQGGASGEKVDEGDEDTLEGAQSAATQASGLREGSAKTAANPGSDTGRTTNAPEGWTRF